MIKSKSILVVALATGLSAILAVCLVYYYINSRIAEERQALEQKNLIGTGRVEQIRVVVASRDLAEGTLIGPDDVRVAELNSDAVKDIAVISDPAAVVGKKMRQALSAGEWVLAAKLAGEDNKDFSAMLAAGRRAIRISVTASSGLLGLIKPSDRVDVIGTFPLENNEQASLTILQNVPVLAVGSETPIPRTTEQAPKAAGNEPDSKALAVTVTLDVSSVEAEKLALAVQVGKIQLVLRNRADQQDTDSGLMQLAALVNVPRPAAKPAASVDPGRKVTVVLGDKIETEVIKK